MSSILIIGDNIQAQEYVSSYARDNSIPSHNITVMMDMKVEGARDLKKKIAFRSPENRLFVISNGITIEGQNALLKCVEEHDERTHFIFIVENEDELLSTVRSRCFVIRLGSESSAFSDTRLLLEHFFKSTTRDWNIIEQLSTIFLEKGPDQILRTLRLLMLENADNSQDICHYYAACKTTLKMLPLVANNNVNPKILLERALLTNYP